jgi:hypothetical protein
MSTRAGTVFNNPAVGRAAIINTPNGGSSRNVRRPDLVAGVESVRDQRRSALPQPGRFRDAQAGLLRESSQRGSLHGPGFTRSTWSSRSTSPSAPPRGTPSSASRSSTCSTGPTSRIRWRPCQMRCRPTRQPKRTRCSRSGVHQRRRWSIRSAHQHGRPYRWPRHAASGAVRVPVQLLTAVTAHDSTAADARRCYVLMIDMNFRAPLRSFITSARLAHGQ